MRYYLTLLDFYRYKNSYYQMKEFKLNISIIIFRLITFIKIKYTYRY